MSGNNGKSLEKSSDQNSGSGQAAKEEAKPSSASTEEAQSPKRSILIFPWRLVLVLCLLPALWISIRWEAGLPSPDEVALYLSESAPFLSGAASDFTQRMFSNWLKVTLFVLIGVAIIYALLQVIGLWQDAHVEDDSQSVMRAITGRQRFVSDAKRYRQNMFDWGAWKLLSPLRAGLSVFPMLGFAGTVAGLSNAIRDLPAAMSSDDALGPVLDSLYVAFDTTLLGLIGAIICLISLRLLEDRVDTLDRQYDDTD